MTGRPPVRPPMYFQNESTGAGLAGCALGLIGVLATFASIPQAFKGSATGRAWLAARDPTSARIDFSTDRGDGCVLITADPSDWVKIEVIVSGDLALRAWCEEVWEEKEFWPDGADGVVPPDGDAPGRTSKRGLWVLVGCSAFPGVPDDGSGYWRLESFEHVADVAEAPPATPATSA